MCQLLLTVGLGLAVGLLKIGPIAAGIWSDAAKTGRWWRTPGPSNEEQGSRTRMNVKNKIATVALGAVALGGLVGVGVSFADGPTTSPSSPTSASPGAPALAGHGAKSGVHAKRALLKRALHGEVTVGGEKGTRVIDFQRGSVQSVSSTAITLKSTDGFTATYVVTADTNVRKNGAAATIGAIEKGDTVRVVALKSGSTDTARLVAEPKTK
jgi:hypothetical protein